MLRIETVILKILEILIQTTTLQSSCAWGVCLSWCKN